LHDLRVISEIGIRHQRADAQSAVGGFFHRLERQMRDVDQPRRPFDLFLHQIYQMGAAGDKTRARVGCDLAHGIGDIVGPRVLEIDHDRSIASRIAATMFG
jgi:hypothetical protein